MSHLIFVGRPKASEECKHNKHYVCYIFIFLKDLLYTQDEHIKQQQKKIHC